MRKKNLVYVIRILRCDYEMAYNCTQAANKYNYLTTELNISGLPHKQTISATKVHLAILLSTTALFCTCHVE